jgi:hypothetical protein
MRHDKFFQPVAAIEIVSLTTGPRTLLTEETIEKGRQRILAGEKPEDVALDLAADEVMMLAAECLAFDQNYR